MVLQRIKSKFIGMNLHSAILLVCHVKCIHFKFEYENEHEVQQPNKLNVTPQTTTNKICFIRNTSTNILLEPIMKTLNTKIKMRQEYGSSASAFVFYIHSIFIILQFITINNMRSGL